MTDNNPYTYTQAQDIMRCVDDLVLAFYNGLAFEQLTEDQQQRFKKYVEAIK